MYDGLHFELDERKYLLGKTLGSGSYGVVVKAFDRLTKQNVAVKQIPNLYEDPETTKKIMREIRVLQSLRSCEYIMSLLDVELSGTSMYMITELCEMDLNTLIQNDTLMEKMDSPKYLSIMRQTLSAICFMHSVNILHRDVKPSNILLDSNLVVRVCDFGLARYAQNCDVFVDPSTPDMTEYVVSRWYRAPEVVLVPGRYGRAQDIWSAGCSFAELVRRKALFPGSSVVNQVHVIVDILGKPTEQDMNFEMSERSRRYMNNMQSMHIGLENVLKPAADLVHNYLYSLLEQMLKFDPRSRILGIDALNHPVFDDFPSVDIAGLTRNINIDLSAIDNCETEASAYVNMMRYIVRDVRQELRRFPYLKRNPSKSTVDFFNQETLKPSPSMAELAAMGAAGNGPVEHMKQFTNVSTNSGNRSGPETTDEGRTPPPTIPEPKLTAKPPIVQRVIERRRSSLTFKNRANLLNVAQSVVAAVVGGQPAEGVKSQLSRAISRDTLNSKDLQKLKTTFEIPQPPSSLPTLKKSSRPSPKKVITRRSTVTATTKSDKNKFDPNASFHVLESISEGVTQKVAAMVKQPVLSSSQSPRFKGGESPRSFRGGGGGESPRRAESPRRGSSSRAQSPRLTIRTNSLTAAAAVLSGGETFANIPKRRNPSTSSSESDSPSRAGMVENDFSKDRAAAIRAMNSNPSLTNLRKAISKRGLV